MPSHPLELFRYCPRCGSTNFKVNNVKSKKCADCGFVYYFNPSAATAIFIHDGERLLVAVRAKDPAAGSYDLPGGFVDMEESSEEAACREVMEETPLEGITPDDLQYLFSLPNIYPYSGFEVHTVDAFFTLRLPDVRIFAGKGKDDVSELLAIPLAALNPQTFGLDSIRRAVHRFIEKHNFVGVS